MRLLKFAPFRALSLAAIAAALLSPAANATPTHVPFKATLDLNEAIAPNTSGASPCALFGYISGIGQATHLGRVTVSSQDCINVISTTTNPPSFAFSSDHVVITAANGDQVFATYSGTLVFQGGAYVVSGGYQIQGGTGRFARASGGGALQGLEDISTMPAHAQIQLDGTISY